MHRMRMRGNPRVYGAAGASVLAAAVTARYIAKWRQRRTMQHRGGGREIGGGRCFIGLDLSDPTAAQQRPCDYAVLDTELVCTFGQWDYREDASHIIPDRAIGRSFILAIDGPQGLAGSPDAAMRASERRVNAPGRTPYTLPADGKPYSGLIIGSVRLFQRLVESGSRFRLLGLDGTPASNATLIEVFPGGAWKVISNGTKLPKKRTLEGRQARTEMLTTLGVQLPSEDSFTDDQLDAAIAAWTAYKLWLGEAVIEGEGPRWDADAGVIREGYVVQPALAPEAEELAA